MPTDQTGHLIAEEAPPRESPIENELPTYRAISTRAVVSLVCGILASFSFADLSFLVFAVLAVVLGVLSLRAIRRNPDVLTGTRLANAGIAMGIIFGLTVVTYTTIQTTILKREAGKFARHFADVLKKGTFGDVMLYREPPDRRKTMTGEDKQKEFDNMKARDRMMLEQRLAPIMGLHKVLRPKDAEIRFIDIESLGEDDSLVGGVYYYAAALYEIDPSSSGGNHRHEYALAIFKGHARGRHYEWWTEDIRFPYEPKTYRVEGKKPADDGHGHAH